ncbi:TlpA family protein disulfide reductase [Xylophilus sp. ASV27]|uniref:TlpA family protein disulfide reductase n=1 Tax=Xylophilus sp. ASV27 TaxID=2795129 RepID=UPI0018EC3C3D|nr:TlpA disulfide reductase family protein [Xylophilus sp. ASV27]
MPESSNTPAAPQRTRRHWLLGGAAGAALLAGAGLSWRRHAASDAPAGGDTAELLWQQSFETPEGAPLDLQALRGRRLLVNFWATWCPPCVEELPMLDQFHREQAARAAAAWQVLGVAVDQPSSVRRFLQKTPVAFPVAMAGLQGTDLSKALGNRQGGLPFTVAIGPDGAVLHRKMGQLSHDDLASWSRT